MTLIAAATLALLGSVAPIELHAKYFTLSIDPSSCNATMSFRHALDGGFSLFPPSKTVGQPTPFLSLYNRVSDNRAQNMGACVGVSTIGDTSDPSSSSQLLRVVAPHGYGSVDIEVTPSNSGTVLTFAAHDVSKWNGDAHEKHIMFGEWWSGLLDNSTAPIVMGKLQGPRALPGPAALSGAPSAGFMTLSGRGYYKYIFYAEAGDAVAFTACPTPELTSIIAATAPASAAPNPRRLDTWYWSGSDVSESTVAKYADLALSVNATILVAMEWDVNLATDPNRWPHGLKPIGDYLASRGLKFGLHMHPDIVYPCKLSLDGNFSYDCLTTGKDISPVVESCPECMVPEGLAPTYRSGDPPNPGYHRSLWTEDIGFWWCHEREGATMCPNGNPKPCGQGSCNRYDWNMSWGSNLTLHGNYHWSKLGEYRIGGAAGFDGAPATYGSVALSEEMIYSLSVADGLTLGLVVHPVSRPASGCLANLSHVFSLCADGGGTLRWTVRTADGSVREAVGTTPLTPGRGYIVKATFNTTSAAALLFIDNKLDHPRHVALSPSSSSPSSPAPSTLSSLAPAPAGSSIRFAVAFEGALEELYLKNVSTETRVGYMYADDNRRLGTYLLDLSRAPGRKKFAELIAAPMTETTIAAVQYDGFEKMSLIAGQDFPHSSLTYQSGLYRGNPTPDWYHFEGWPLRWGLGVLQGMTAAHDEIAAKVSSPSQIPAIEASFMAPGLGPWRADMAPYVDERGDLLDLGLEWHGKLLQRIELTTTMVNAYGSLISPLTTTTPFLADYWFGGLVSAGVAPQPRYGHTNRIDPNVTSSVRRWLERYGRWGHTLEGHVHTLVYDSACCHVQGLCEWIACDDAVLTSLSGGSDGDYAPSGGLILGSPLPVVVPPALLQPSARGGRQGETHATGSSGVRLVVFQTARVSRGLLTAGSAADRSLSILLSSPVLNATTLFSGGFFDLGANTTATTIYLTVKDAMGATLSHRKIIGPPSGVHAPLSGVHASTTTGEASTSFLFDRAKEAPNQPPPLELLFAKESEQVSSE
jgi:hypothetical protein